MKTFYVSFFVLMLGGCLSTPYRPKDKNGGYEDYVIDQEKHLYGIRTHGNSWTSLSTLERHAKWRAGELCRAKGFGSFNVAKAELDCAERGLDLDSGCEQIIVHKTIQCLMNEEKAK